MKFVSVAVAAATLLAAGAAYAQVKPDELLKARQGLFVAAKMNFGGLKAVADGQAPVDAAAVAKAENLVAAARLIPTTFGKGSEDLPGTNTKPAAFTDPEFAKIGADFQAATAKLVEATKGGKADEVRSAFAGVGKTCKSCHESFRKE